MTQVVARLLAWCALGATVGLVFVWWSQRTPQGLPMTWQAERGMTSMGVTAALLWHARGATLLDLRPASPDDLPVPGAVKFDLAQLGRTGLESPASGQSLILIGDERQVSLAAASLTTIRPLGYVPAFTLKRATGLPAQAEVSTARLSEKLKQRRVRLFDLREVDEFNASRIFGSEQVSLFEVASRIPKGTQQVALFCQTGHRSAFVVRRLRAQGFTNVVSVRGGWLDWKAQGRPLIGEQPRTNERSTR